MENEQTLNYAAVLADLTTQPFPNHLLPSLASAIVFMSQRLTPIVAGGGVTQGGNILREEFGDGSYFFRLDLENLRGQNLRK